MAHPDMRSSLDPYVNQTSYGDTFEIDTRKGLLKMRVTGTFCDLNVIFCKEFL